MADRVSIWQRFDYILLAAVVILVVFGIMMIDSATQDAIDDDIISRVPDQINYALVGFVIVLVVATIDYRLLGGVTPWLYGGMVILLVIVRLFGVEGAGGATRWLNVGIRIQPSEIGKIILIITLSQYVSERYLQLDKLSMVFRTLLHVAIPAGLIFLQPDLGTTLVFLFIWAAVIWSAGLRLKHIAMFGLAIAIALPIVFPLLPGYQRLRVETFLNPDTTSGAFYNINQALISIGSGGVFGKGYYVGTQNTGRFLRVRHTDFIFSVIAHEFGMAGGLAVLGMFALVLWRILKGRAPSQRPHGQHDLLWRGGNDLLPDDGVDWHEPESDAGNRLDPALRQLWRHVAAVYHGGHRLGAKRHRAPPPPRILGRYRLASIQRPPRPYALRPQPNRSPAYRRREIGAVWLALRAAIRRASHPAH